MRREREGRVHRCHLDPRPLETAGAFIDRLRTFWEGQLEALARYVEEDLGDEKR